MDEKLFLSGENRALTLTTYTEGCSMDMRYDPMTIEAWGV